MGSAASGLLSPEESLWLKSRNNTIVVYPEKNFPPYSYQNSAGFPQGLSVDYIELIAEKVGAHVEYLPARSRSQILEDVKQKNKGDVVTSVTDTKEKEEYLYFSDTYISIPTVIVMRKDADVSRGYTLNDLTGKKVAIGSKYGVEEYVRTTNPRIVIESVVDDESGLQQVVLGEVDAAVMDIASLSYYLSKQVLNSVKVVGNTGFEYKMSFGVPKDKEILQSILDKGLQQISANDRQIFTDKWIIVPNENTAPQSALSLIINNTATLIGVGVGVLVLVIFLFTRRRHEYFSSHLHRKAHVISELQQEMSELEDTSKGLLDELNEVHALEQDIKEKMKDIEK